MSIGVCAALPSWRPLSVVFTPVPVTREPSCRSSRRYPHGDIARRVIVDPPREPPDRPQRAEPFRRGRIVEPDRPQCAAVSGEERNGLEFGRIVVRDARYERHGPRPTAEIDERPLDRRVEG
jgi:hypothetical protein